VLEIRLEVPLSLFGKRGTERRVDGIECRIAA